MIRKIIFTLLICLILTSDGCKFYKQEKYLKDNIYLKAQSDIDLSKMYDSKHYTLKIIEAAMFNGDRIYFNNFESVVDLDKGEIVGYDLMNRQVILKINDVLYIKVENKDAVLTTLASTGIVIVGAAAVIMVIALAGSSGSHSCPLVFTNDGSKYEFDAEPLGGAICRGLQRSDIARLDYIKPKEGRYLLRFNNQKNETQYIDEVKLKYVNHPKDKFVYPDWQGNLFLTGSPIPPVSVYDENNTDITKLLCFKDNNYWQTKIPFDSVFSDDSLRHCLTFKFIRPKNVNRAGIVYNGGTSRWGSVMIKELIELYGNKIDDWYKGVNSGGAEFFETLKLGEREEHLFMRFYVKENGSWNPKGYISGWGPLIYEDRIVWFDLDGVVGDTIELKINPPKTFWAFDYLGITTGSETPVIPEEADMISAGFEGDKSAAKTLNSVDGKYLVMKNPEDSVMLSFSAPDPLPEMNRSVFLKITGYYNIKTDNGKPKNDGEIKSILNEKGKLIRFSLKKFKECINKDK